MIQSDLCGHSGCRVVLCESDNGEVFVRKTSGSIEYNERLKKQENKQKEFEGIKVRTPKVLRDGYTEDGLFYFDMEYIRGITLAEYIKKIEIGKIRGIVETLVINIFPESNNREVRKNVFAHKIDLLRNNLMTLNNPIVNEALLILQQHNWDGFSISPCHGDMTLENIIVKDDKLYFIDFLDSFYDSWILDVGTLMQDVQAMWSYRNESVNMNTVIRLMVFRDVLMDMLKDRIGNQYVEVYYALLLKLIRIYPYTKDINTVHFCDGKVQMVLDMIKKAGAGNEDINYSMCG